MQPLDAVTMKHLAREWHGMLSGARVSKIQHLASHDYLITFWGGGLEGAPSRGDYHGVYLNLNPAHPVVAMINPKSKNDWVVPEFEKPTGTCLLLRKHLNNALLLKLETIAGERVLNFYFENFNELGNKVQLLLSIEIMGKHTNMILVDCMDDAILGVAHGVSAKMSQFRELMPGLPYAPPPLPVDKTFLSQLTKSQFSDRFSSVSKENLLKSVQQQFLGWGGDLLKNSLGNVETLDLLYDGLFNLEAGIHLSPAYQKDFTTFRLLSPQKLLSADWIEVGSVDELLRVYYGHQLKQKRRVRYQQMLLQILEKQMVRLNEQKNTVTPEVEAVIERDKHWGDLILTASSSGHLSKTPTETTVLLDDYLTGKPVEIAIDPALDWQQNAQVYYKKVKKAHARAVQAKERLTGLTQQTDYLAQMQCLVMQADDLQTLILLEEEITAAGLIRQKKRKIHSKKSQQGDGKKMRGVAQFVSSDGFTLFVGKSGLGNQEVVKQAKSHDLWLHVAEGPGSHVVVKTEKQDIPDTTLLEACNLAVHFSKARGSLNVPVLYTDIKYVKTIPGSYPGHVNYKNEQSVFISVDERIIDGFLN